MAKLKVTELQAIARKMEKDLGKPYYEAVAERNRMLNDTDSEWYQQFWQSDFGLALIEADNLKPEGFENNLLSDRTVRYYLQKLYPLEDTRITFNQIFDELVVLNISDADFDYEDLKEKIAKLYA